MTRRELAGTLLAAVPLEARRIDRRRISAITDEIGATPEDSIAFARRYKLEWVELRSVPGTKREYAFTAEAELKATAVALARDGLKVSFLNTSLLKFPWPGTEPARQREETPEARARRLEAEAARFSRRMDNLRKAIAAAHILGVDKVRVFAGTRVAEPERMYPRIAEVLGEMGFVAGKEKVHLLIENEPSCNVGSSAELAAILKLLPSKWVGINWDAMNCTALKETPFPDGYSLLPKDRIGNVQMKGHSLLNPERRLDWKAIFAALDRDGYRGQVGLETHYREAERIEASHASMREIMRLIGEA